MKKSIIISTVCASLLATSMPFVYAEENSTVTIRIEGINECLYYGEYDGTENVLGNILSDIDLNDDSLSIVGIEDNYITDINGNTAGSFGGWDGWLYRVNEVEPSVGINDYIVENGDSIVLYYGDPYGVGMQYPIADISEIENGIITFTSLDAVYDADYNVSYELNPVEGMAVNWQTDDEVAIFITDENGQIQIPSGFLSEGTHNVTWSKATGSGVPAVLRPAPDYSIEIKSTEVTTETTTETTISQTETTTIDTSSSDETKPQSTSTTTNTTISKSTTTGTSSPQTGDTISFVAMAGLVAGLTVIISKKKK